ncbi:hypothetical protein AVEN_263962-1 [Araneus ventricosus]|uniref:Uncharacterized protein n=1 Tax=Araneus ventricosus TaxID=182803 RepID=A0A4Y2HNH7_ARAVE|nr:hypothetical protein AVEN_263962-1 [Araneus ventricosus]
MWSEMESFEEDEFSWDIDLMENYRDQYISMKSKVNLILSTSEGSGEISKVVNETKYSFHLPKLELKSFDGDIKNWLWLGFWGQFKKFTRMMMIVLIWMTNSSFFCKRLKLVCQQEI